MNGTSFGLKKINVYNVPELGDDEHGGVDREAGLAVHEGLHGE